MHILFFCWNTSCFDNLCRFWLWTRRIACWKLGFKRSSILLSETVLRSDQRCCSLPQWQVSECIYLKYIQLIGRIETKGCFKKKNTLTTVSSLFRFFFYSLASLKTRSRIWSSSRWKSLCAFSSTRTPRYVEVGKKKSHRQEKERKENQYLLTHGICILLQVTGNLTQEFVRIRPTREHDREAIVLALCKRTYKSKVVVRFQIIVAIIIIIIIIIIIV